MSRNACNPRGFATTTALIYMGVLAVVIGLMSVNLATNVHRTVSARREAQFRQLLIAGAISARSHLEQETAEKEWRLDVPNANDSQPSVAIELPSTSRGEY